MTIHTGFFNDKKPAKLITASTDVESCPDTAFAPLRAPMVPRDNRDGRQCMRITAYVCILMMSCAAALLCLQLIQFTTDEPVPYYGALGIPYDSNDVNYEAIARVNERFQMNQDAINRTLFRFLDNPFENDDSFFRESFELDLSDDQSYSKVNVPDFRDNRKGRFVHDFKFNQSLILDQDNLRCFVMPLDRETVLQPRSMYDLVTKMLSGYYNIDTEVVRKNMRVVLPPLTDVTDVAPRIVNECQGMKIFRLEKFQSGVFKRSISELASTGKFGGFTGKHIVEFNLINIDEVAKY